MKLECYKSKSSRKLFLLLSIFMIWNNITLFAQHLPGDDDPGTFSWKMSIIGKRMLDGYTKQIYNGDNPLKAVRHCNNDFLFITYPGVENKFRGIINSGTSLTYTLEVQITEDGVITYPASGVGFATVPTGTDIDKIFTTTGYKQVIFKITDPSLMTSTIIGRVLVLKKVTDILIDAPEVCLTTYDRDNDYKFNLQTVPPLGDLFPSGFIPSFHSEFSVGGYCEDVGDMEVKLEFLDESGYFVNTYAEFPAWYARFNRFILGGYKDLFWSPTGWSEINKFYCKKTDFNSWLSSTSIPPMLSKVTYSDGVTSVVRKFSIAVQEESIPANYNNSRAFYIWEYNKHAASISSGHTAEPFGTIHAPAHETWTPTNNPMVNEGFGTTVSTIRIKDKIVIGKGQSLTIKDMVVEMGKDAQIIVQSDPTGAVEAGRLILDNSTIKAYRACGNEQNFWKGIVLQGNSSLSQEHIAGDFDKRRQAMLYMSNNATLADAEVAVRSYDPAHISTKAGGIIYAFNAHFQNNKVAVDIAPYYNAAPVPSTSGYACRFEKCTFSFDNSELQSQFEGFARIEGVKDIPFSACHFSTNLGTAMLGYGVRAYDASILVRGDFRGTAPCYFKGLMDAVSVNKTAFGTHTTFYANNCQFVQNYTGLYCRAINNPYIRSNSFLVPPRPTPSFAGRNASGINLETGSGYICSNNSFDQITSAPAGTQHNNAVLVWNSGSANNFVRDNQVSNLSQGMVANFMNRNNTIPATGLQFLCNSQHNNVGTCIAALGTDPTRDGIRAEQGSNALAAGNTFGHVLYDIYNPSAEVGGLNYFYNSNPNAEPTLTLGASTTSTSSPDGCSTSPLGASSSTSTSTSTTTGLVVGTPIAMATTGLSGLALREALLHNAQAYQLNADMPNRISLLHNTLADLADAYSDLERVNLYLQSGEISAANTLYNGIVSNRGLTGAEAYEFSHWGRQLLDISIELQQAGLSPRQLSSSQVSSLSTIADNATMWAKVRAQNWLRLYDGRSYTNNYLYPPTTSGGNQRKAIDNELDMGDGLNNALYPNPATNELTLRYNTTNHKVASIQVQISNVLGQVIWQQNYPAKGLHKIDVQNWASGLYFYTIREENNITLSGKLIKK